MLHFQIKQILVKVSFIEFIRTCKRIVRYIFILQKWNFIIWHFHSSPLYWWQSVYCATKLNLTSGNSLRGIYNTNMGHEPYFYGWKRFDYDIKASSHPSSIKWSHMYANVAYDLQHISKSTHCLGAIRRIFMKQFFFKRYIIPKGGLRHSSNLVFLHNIVLVYLECSLLAGRLYLMF